MCENKMGIRECLVLGKMSEIVRGNKSELASTDS